MGPDRAGQVRRAYRRVIQPTRRLPNGDWEFRLDAMTVRVRRVDTIAGTKVTFDQPCGSARTFDPFWFELRGVLDWRHPRIQAELARLAQPDD